MKIFIVLFVALISFDTFSCDVCGGVSAPGTQGLLSSNKFHFIGIKQSYNSFRSIHGTHSSFTSATSEHFLRSSLVGKWQFAQRFNVQAELPYTVNIQKNGSNTRSEQGIGDLNLLCNYLVVNVQNDEGMTVHALRAGAGIKLATGKYSTAAWETSNLYPGTGSFDAMLTTNYVFRKENFGFLQENSITLNGENKYEYRYGNSYFMRNSIFLNKTLSKQRSFLPSLGLSYLYTATDRIDGFQVGKLFNSGHSLNAELSLNLLTKQWMFNFKGAYPLAQYMGNGDVRSKGTVQLSILYLIQKK